MQVAAGQTVYKHGAPPCSGVGILWSSGDLDDALANRVAPLVFDDAGKIEISNILSSLSDTGFAQDRLQQILAAVPSDVEDWRIGEAIAEAYITDHRNCMFPWPAGRDARNSKASLPGTDLVGFRSDADGDAFAFGEVKTSSEAKHPPSVMRSLQQQLKNLRDRQDIRNHLMLYLGSRAKGTPWQPQFQAASIRFLKSSSDVYLYGILIRDLAPHADDLQATVTNLAAGCPTDTSIEFVALYLPAKRIKGIGRSLVQQRQGGSP